MIIITNNKQINIIRNLKWRERALTNTVSPVGLCPEPHDSGKDRVALVTVGPGLCRVDLAEVGLLVSNVPAASLFVCLFLSLFVFCLPVCFDFV
jgi:hypothetical protein